MAKLISHPDRGGLEAESVRYPGHAKSIGTVQNTFIYPGEGHSFCIEEDDLVQLACKDEGVGACLFLGVLGDGAIFPELTDASPAPSGEGLSVLAFDDRLVRARLAARDKSPTDLTWFNVSALIVGEPLLLKAAVSDIIVTVVPALSDAVVGGAAQSALTVRIDRPSHNTYALPDPLGHIRDEFRINRGTGIAYEVRKGEFIQVIDIEGRQCSDFMALNAKALEGGQERLIDSTVTRTMTSGAYPQPGLHDKFFDQNMQPLLAVTQDTVGRHDTFALACTARGYEDRGFPGHVNCSDNISAALSPYGVKRRDAWPAINFFFNSWITPEDNHLRSDEAWSRAGDFVVMRALTDLVCASTACPDDIDPINGWNPTDIHVRIYAENAPIQHAVAYRPTADTAARLTRPSPFAERTQRLTSRFHPARDYWMAQAYDETGAIEEYWACRERATIQDMSAMRKFDVSGPDAEALLQACLTRDVSKIALNRGAYALVCDRQGHVIDDGTLFHIAPQVYRWCASSDESGIMLREAAEELGLRAWVRDMTLALANLAIQGPKSRDVLVRMAFTQPAHPAVENLKWFGQTIARVGDRNGAPFMLTRTGFTGELGYELFCDPRDATEIWDAVIAAGTPEGLVPMGAEALEMMRIEAGLASGGAEFTGTEDPDEAGVGFAVDMKKAAFTGRAPIERNRLAQRQKLVGLIFDGNDVPHHGDAIFDGRRQIGVVTSAARSPALQSVIALARIAVELAETGTAVEVGRLDGQIKRLPAKVSDIPFIDPKREKPRS